MPYEKMQDAIRGSLLGGAIGDALGYAVEFRQESEIFHRFGAGGIRSYEVGADGLAQISDDTQMTLFTANGILYALTRAAAHEDARRPEFYVAKAYQDWLRTQMQHFSEDRLRETDGKRVSWLMHVPQLYSRRAPGITCMSALQASCGDGSAAENYSKGCGGVMRVAPMGLVHTDTDIEQADRSGAAFAAITHGHSLGYMPAAVLVHIVRRIVYAPGGRTLRQIVEDARDTTARIFAGDEHLDALTAIIDRAIGLSENADSDLDNIHRLGEGWVGEEALAIAIYCALRYENDFSAGIIAAVNHRGDSDSTGAVTGNILGARIGFDAIDPKWKTDLELRDVLLEMADDLYYADRIGADTCAHGTAWAHKYIDCDRLQAHE